LTRNWLDRLGCPCDPKLGSVLRNNVINTKYRFI
jgi:hypothetical protein